MFSGLHQLLDEVSADISTSLAMVTRWSEDGTGLTYADNGNFFNVARLSHDASSSG